MWRLTAVMVKNHPQENYHEPNPSASTVMGVEPAAYDGKSSGDVPGFEVAPGGNRLGLLPILEGTPPAISVTSGGTQTLSRAVGERRGYEPQQAGGAAGR